MSASWRSDVTALCVLYLILESGKTFEIKDEHANPIFRIMATAGLIEDMGLEWAVTDVGRESMKRAVAAQDVLRQMEIFARVDVAIPLALEEQEPEHRDRVRPELWDPRFADANEHAYDMRLAVITWLGDTVSKKPVMPETIVFLQKLGSGQFDAEHFWRDVSSCFVEVDSIVANAYKWQDAAPGEIELADQRMKAIYAAGQLEQRKRDGNSCSECGIPLVIFEQAAAERKEALEACPSCDHCFSPLEPTSMTCPKCSASIYDGDPRCGGCGATIDFSLPAGTVQTDTVETTETMWSSSYGYVSYGWLDPFDPFLDVVALSCIYYDPWLY